MGFTLDMVNGETIEQTGVRKEEFAYANREQYGEHELIPEPMLEIVEWESNATKVPALPESMRYTNVDRFLDEMK